MLKKILRPFVPQIILNYRKDMPQKKIINEWKKKGCPIPPPHIVKQFVVKEYQKKYGHRILVETGTYYGDMVEAQKNIFLKIFSIELGTDLFEMAKARFKNDKNVFLIQGDSGKKLPEVLAAINEPAIFWLDGHYSEGVTAKGDKECPIMEELCAIFSNKVYNHILLIDDARCFNGQGDYPTIEKLTEYIISRNKKYKVEVKHDIIRYVI